MSTAYWSQWSYSEIMSMHGIEDDHGDDDYDDCESESCNHDEYEERCPRCSGTGCNYCLMLSY